MRFSPRRTLLWLLLMVVVQLTVYYFVIAPSRRGRPSRSQTPRLSSLPAQRPDGQGTCDFKRCPSVKKDMINVHLIPHSHDDVGWLKTVEQYYSGDNPKSTVHAFGMPEGHQCVRCTLKTAIKELLKNPQRRFIFIEMAFFSRFWDEIDNRTRQQVQSLIERRQLEIVLGGWVMSDAAVTYYNDIIDQHTLGFDFLQKTFGPCAQSRVAWHVDQFGHSREHAAIFTKMGFDALFVGRIDYQDHNKRKSTKTFEFVWETSPNAKDYSGNLFTHVTFDGYYAPRGFVLDGVSDLHKESTLSFMDIVRERAETFRTNHLLLPMGSDFGYSNAGDWFRNMDKLIKLVNEKQRANSPEKGPKINLVYSTPSCYMQYVHNSNLTWPVKTDDFHPYGISPGAYWTGYFTSRCGQKLLIKKAGAMLQACKQLGIFSRLDDAFNRTDVLRKAVAVMQHHDAITGTEKQHVSNDYNRMMSEGMEQCQSVISEAYNKLLAPAEGEAGYKFSYCPELNISQCAATEGQGSFMVLAYNPLSRPVSTWLRLPVTQHAISVRDSQGRQVPSQLAAVPEGVVRLPERTSSESDTELVFPVNLPAMGYASFTVAAASGGGQKPMRTNIGGASDIIMKNKYLKVTFDRRTGRMKELSNLSSNKTTKISQDMAFYRGVQGGFRSSGAYVFVPEKELPHRVGNEDPVGIRFYDGPLVQEVHQQFSSWVSQVIRLYKDSQYLELQWTVGPIPLGRENQGKEVVSFFVSDLKSNGRFYTDSNGREVLQRRLNKRETWNLTVADPISGNYYPVTSRIYLKSSWSTSGNGGEKPLWSDGGISAEKVGFFSPLEDEADDRQRNGNGKLWGTVDVEDEASDTQLTVLPDRVEGGSSLHDGTLELMVHRRLLYDDGLGVGEPLDERGVDPNEGIVYTGKHFLFLDTIANSAALTREMGLNLHLHPTITFLPLSGPEEETSKMGNVAEKSFLAESLPSNIQVLTLDYTTNNQTAFYLLRLEHIYEKGEHPKLSEPASVQLKNLFTPFEVSEVEEVSLGGNFNPRAHNRLKWTTHNHHVNTHSIATSDYKEQMQEPFTVTLKPMEIRTFRVYVSTPTPSTSLFF